MTANVTFKGVDFLDPRSVEHAVRILTTAHQHARQRVELFGEEEVAVRNHLARTHVFAVPGPASAPVSAPVSAPASVSASVSDLSAYRGRTKDFLDVMTAAIAAEGAVTLEAAASKAGVNLETARAFLRNAGRTDRANNTQTPFVRQWNHAKNCAEYVAR